MKIFHRSDLIFFAIVAVLVIAAFAKAQGPPVPQDRPGVPRDDGAPAVPGASKPLPKPKQVAAVETPAQARDRAVKEGKPYAVFVGVAIRSIPGVVCVRMDDLDDGGNGPRIMVYPLTARGWHAREAGRGTLPATATDAAIRREAGLSLPAIPFEKLNAKREARGMPSVDGVDSPWLSGGETAAIKAAWPKGVAFGKNLKFYSLAPRYQNLWTMDGGRFKGWRADPLDEEFRHELVVSGGMASLNASAWKSVKGLDIPEGKKIAVWKEDADVRAFALVPRWRWQFPVGTTAYDVLFSGDSIFEIRTQTRSESEWETKITYRNKAAAPADYRVTVRACASCHNLASEIVDVPGRIYRHVVWGDDGRFSFRPFMEDGNLDLRWPLAAK